MTTITFDTLEFTEQLKEFGVPENQAKGHARAMAHILEQVEESRLKEMATKRDIKELEVKIAETKTETIKWMVGLLLAQTGLIITALKLFPSH
ncbi:MAG: hypothetical protein H7829_10865 [Magnetococcus sp. THC-1_WYH]